MIYPDSELSTASFVLFRVFNAHQPKLSLMVEAQPFRYSSISQLKWSNTKDSARANSGNLCCRYVL
jgi:hypothetical protein